VDVRLVILNNNLYIILIDKDMKPLNLDNKPCSPTSSNCVIWSGRNLACINLCTGDTITDVIEKLATELCAIIDQLNISNYDLSCFNITACPPSSFAELLQFLIEQICANQNIPTTGKDLSSGCPDCPVQMADCFITGSQTTMQLVDYVDLIARRVCSLGETIINMQTQITNIDNRVTILENEPDPVFTLPTITVDCTLQDSPFIGDDGPATSIDLVLDALINDDTYGYCALKFRTGEPGAIYTAITTQCIQDGDFTLSNPLLTYGTAYFGSWVETADIENLADSITNIWIVLCDIYNGIPKTVVEAGEGITVTSTVVGNETTYTVTNDYLETFQAVLAINDDWEPTCGIINSIFPGNATTPGAPTFGGTPSSYKGVNEGKPIIRYNAVTSNSVTVTPTVSVGGYVSAGCMPPFSFGTFDNETGIFTITDPGTYLIHAMIHLKSQNNTSDAFWSGDPTTHTLLASPPPTTYTLNDNFTNTGSFVLGLHPSNNSDTYVAQGQTLIPGIDRCVEISVSRVLATTIPRAVRVKVLNTTNRDYDGTVYDNTDAIYFSIVKLRNNLTDVDCYDPPEV
jgi:hypothetical protein